MVEQPVQTESPWSLIAYALVALLLSGGMIALSHILGERHKGKATGQVYESGIGFVGDARLKFPVQFYLIAMFFVIFDLEAVFLIAWAIALKDVGWMGYLGALAFVMILLAVLVYEWKMGALDFGPKGKKILQAYWKLKK